MAFDVPSSTYLAQQKLNWFRSAAGFTFPATPGTLYISLHTAAPGGNGQTGDVTTALVGGRVSIAGAGFSAPAASPAPSLGQRISNTSSLLMSASATATATLTHFGIWNAASAGNFLAYGVITPAVTILNGDVVRFNAGQLVIEEL